MIEFVVIFLVVLSCCGVLFIVLLFLPKAFPFFANCGSRIRAFFVDWRVSVNRNREQSQAFMLYQERRRREVMLDRERRRRERNHLRSGWDWNWLVASVCGLLFGLFVCWRVDSHHSDLNRAVAGKRFPVRYSYREFSTQAEFNAYYEFSSFLFDFWAWTAFLSFLCVLVFGVVFCRRYFSAGARYRCIVDREEGLKAERRRQQEGGQDD